jgi:putative transposase
VAGDLLDRSFPASVANRVWAGDFTYVRSLGGFVYVAFVVDVDVFARAGHRLARRHRQTHGLVVAPVRMALWERERTGRPVVGG